MEITANEVFDNYSLFNDWMDSLPVGPSGTTVESTALDLGIDSNIPIVLMGRMGVPLNEAATWFHAFTYAVWLMREKKGL